MEKYEKIDVCGKGALLEANWLVDHVRNKYYNAQKIDEISMQLYV
jgi:hypothetical protein